MTQDTQSIAAAKILPRAKVEGLKSCVDLACLTEDRSLLLTGWLYDPNAEVRGLSVLQEDDGGLSKSKRAATGQWLSTVVRFGQRHGFGALTAVFTTLSKAFRLAGCGGNSQPRLQRAG